MYVSIFNEKNFLFDFNYAYNFFCSTYENIALIANVDMKLENEKLNEKILL